MASYNLVGLSPESQGAAVVRHRGMLGAGPGTAAAIMGKGAALGVLHQADAAQHGPHCCGPHTRSALARA